MSLKRGVLGECTGCGKKIELKTLHALGRELLCPDCLESNEGQEDAVGLPMSIMDCCREAQHAYV